MNADSEWNDARQCVFAPLYLDFYRETGDAELFERGVAALRAAFSMLYCPENGALRAAYERRHPLFGPESFGFMMENQGHGAGDPVGPFAIFSWGNGLALAAAATVRDLYGDVYVDAKRRAAFGLDGCEAHVLGERVEVESRYERATLTAVYAGGGRHEIALERRCGVLPLRGVASLDPAR